MSDFVGHDVHSNGENGRKNAVFTRNLKSWHGRCSALRNETDFQCWNGFVNVVRHCQVLLSLCCAPGDREKLNPVVTPCGQWRPAEKSADAIFFGPELSSDTLNTEVNDG